MAREGQIDPVIGRDDEIEQTIEMLSRRSKNNPVLIGEAGVGKTAIVEGLAQRIVDDDVPQTLAGKRVVQLELSGVVAGTRYRGDFEERVKRIIDEIREHRDDLIIFIDELHTLVGAGGSSEGGMDAGNMLKPALARGELHIVGATTLDEYRKNIEKDAALARRFQPILVPEPTVDDTITILRGLRDRYEAHHQVRYTDEALVAAVELSTATSPTASCRTRRSTSSTRPARGSGCGSRRPAGTCATWSGRPRNCSGTRTRPSPASSTSTPPSCGTRSARSGSRSRIWAATRPRCPRSPRTTSPRWSRGPPASRCASSPRRRRTGCCAWSSTCTTGSSARTRRSRRSPRRSAGPGPGWATPNRPVGSFLFLGPTGVGKTELARALTEALFGADSRMIRLDMSEFQERHTVSRLVGAPPGYVGYDEAGQLTEAVRRRPYSVILLDEIEKAHPDVFNILLQVLDDGRLTDGQGRTVDFKNTVLIMTSNLGSDLITRRAGPLGFAGSSSATGSAQQDNLQEQLMRRLRESFRPEFLNRIDEIIIFRQLDETELRQITELMLQETQRRLHAQDVTLEFTPAAVDWIAQHGYQPEFGARPMRRVIQREVDNELSRRLLDGQINPGQEVIVDVEDGHLTFIPHEQQVPAHAG